MGRQHGPPYRWTGSVREVNPERAHLFLKAAEIACGLACDPVVAAHWADESACAGMTVGGLAHHLTDQVRTIVAFVGAPPSDDGLVDLPAFYRLASWVWSAADDPGHVELREGANGDASVGPAAFAERVATDLDALRAVLADVERRTPDAVFVPWEGVALSTGDWLLSREVELVVHADDLAVSVGLPTPHFPAEVVADVLAAMTALSVERHGANAVVRAIARPQRAGSVAPF